MRENCQFLYIISVVPGRPEGLVKLAFFTSILKGRLTLTNMSVLSDAPVSALLVSRAESVRLKLHMRCCSQLLTIVQLVRCIMLLYVSSTDLMNMKRLALQTAKFDPKLC